MTDRIGVCAGCGTRFKVPPAFRGAAARCKKCGGTVTIGVPAAPARARPASSPPATPPRTPAAAAPPAKSKRVAPTVPRDAATAAGQSAVEPSPPLGPGARIAKAFSDWIVGWVIAAILLGSVAYLLITSDDEDDPVPSVSASGSDHDASSATAPPVATTAAGSKAGPDANSEPEPKAPESQEPPEPPEPQPVAEVLPAKIEFQPFARPSTVGDEDWRIVQDSVRILFLETTPPAQREDALGKLRDRRLAAIGSMIDAMNGLDLSRDASFLTAARLVNGIQELSLGLIAIDFHGDPRAMIDEVQWNAKCARSLIGYWTKQMAKPADFQRQLDEAIARGEGTEDF